MKTTTALGIEHQEVDICDVKIVVAKIANNCILHNYQADRFNYTPRGEIQLPKVNRRGLLVLYSCVIFQGGTMATYWLVGRKEEEREA